MRLPIDRGLRALVAAALEDVANAETTGRWLDAAVAMDLVAAELRSRACIAPSIEASREGRLTRAERRTP